MPFKLCRPIHPSAPGNHHSVLCVYETGLLRKGSTYKWYPTAFTLIRLAYFTSHNSFLLCPRCHKREDLAFLMDKLYSRVCVCVCVCARVHAHARTKSLQSRLTLLQPHVLYSSPGSSVSGILLVRILEWAAMPSSRGSFQPSDQTRISCIAGRFFTSELLGKSVCARARPCVCKHSRKEKWAYE